MKTPLLIAVLALALSLVGLLSPWLLGPGAGDRAVPSEAQAADASDPLARLEEVSGAIRDLEERIVALEMRPDAGPAQRMPVLDGFVRKEDLAALIQELGLEGLGVDPKPSSGEALTPELEGQVVEALASIRRQEQLERAFASRGKDSGTVEQQVAGWSKWLELDDHQQARVAEMIELRNSMEDDVLQAWKNGAEPETIEEALSQHRTDFHRSFRGVLSPEQAARFNSKFGDGSDG